MARLNSKMLPELTDSALSQLFAKNIFTVFDFVMESNDKLTKYTELTFKDICEIKKCIFETYSGQTRELKLEEDDISTGIEKLDILLKNGFHKGQIYEICGLPSSGKSQLCMTFAANIVLNSSKSVHYIDTKRDFCATRILNILEAKKCTDEQIGKVMHSIKVSRVTNINELLTLLYGLTNSLKSDNTSTIIIDSLPAIVLKSSKNNTATINLNQLSNVCKFLIKECQQVMIITNIISQWSEVDGFVLDQETKPVTIKPTLGKYWLHVPDTRLLMEQLENEKRKISVWKSTVLKLQTFCTVNITEAGVN